VNLAGAGQGAGETTDLSAGATSARTIALAGVRLSSGILVAKELLAGEAAAASPAASAGTLAADGAAAGWYGPNDIVSAVSQASKPTVLFDSNGDGHAIFESAGKILYAYQPSGGTWDAPRKMGRGASPTAVLDAQGMVNAAYTSEFMGNWDILHLRMTPTGWNLPKVVAPTTGRSADPVIGADPAGKIYVAWMDLTSGEWAIQLGTYDGNFWTSYPVPNARGQSPALTIMPDGALFMLWQDRIPLATNEWGNYDIFASERKDKIWSLPVNVSDNRQFHPGSNSIGPRVVSTTDGLAHLAWIDDKTQLRYDFGRGQYWPAPVDVGGPLAKAEGLSMRVAADGLLYLAWNESATVRVVASPPRTQYWPAANTVATRSTPANGQVSDVFLTNGRDRIAVAWVQDNLSGSMGVYESRHNTGPVMSKSFLPMLMQP
jgi:hypothetical protein